MSDILLGFLFLCVAASGFAGGFFLAVLIFRTLYH